LQQLADVSPVDSSLSDGSSPSAETAASNWTGERAYDGLVRRVIILGSTGSIGTQALDVVAANPDRFRVVGLSAGRNADELAAQAERFGVVDTALGADDSELLVRSVEADVVLNGITGSVGLGPTLAALETGAMLALANKESLIVGGALVKRAAAPGQIVPVDSEHSAIAQALRSGAPSEVRRLVLTASGGPFRGRSRESLRDVTPQQALAHPTWDMGLVVTTNSSTLVNKGLEVIEAHLLFDVPYDRIDVTVHPQSVIHSMVEFVDGSTIAQASPPDMRLPISLGLGWPDRVPEVGVPLDWTTAHTWTFEPLDGEAFPAVALAKRVGMAAGTYPAVFNAANEQAVTAFHAGAIGYLDILGTVERVVDAHVPSGELTRASLADAERWARTKADALIAAH
jgi:1-deoxy-D-xylulose-5-phosphate reductoisomerase